MQYAGERTDGVVTFYGAPGNAYILQRKVYVLAVCASVAYNAARRGVPFNNIIIYTAAVKRERLATIFIGMTVVGASYKSARVIFGAYYC